MHAPEAAEPATPKASSGETSTTHMPRQNLEIPIRYRLLELASRWGLTNLLEPGSRNRAEHLVSNSGILGYLENGGTYLDIGTGPGHILEELVKNESGKDVRYIGLDPFATPFRESVRGYRRTVVNIYL